MENRSSTLLVVCSNLRLSPLASKIFWNSGRRRFGLASRLALAASQSLTLLMDEISSSSKSSVGALKVTSAFNPYLGSFLLPSISTPSLEKVPVSILAMTESTSSSLAFLNPSHFARSSALRSSGVTLPFKLS